MSRLILDQYSGIYKKTMIYCASFKGRNWLLLIFIVFRLQVAGQIHFDQRSEYRYLKGPAAASLSSDWVSPSFNDAYWTKGYAPFWYGDGSGGTFLDDMQDNYSTLYLRSIFRASNSQQIHELQFEVDYDDGFIIWINGIQVLNMYGPENPGYNDFATDLHESGTPETFYINATGIPLFEGNNTIAVQVFNANLGSSDLHFNVTLDAGLDLPVYPDTIEVEFSRASGYYSAPFDLSFNFNNDSATLYYTLDGSHPGLSSEALTYAKGSTILIDPDSDNNRGKTPAVVVRTAFRLAGYRPSPPASGTFIFAEKINYQEHPGGDWPGDNVNDQRLDFAIDQDIALGSLYSGRMEGAYKNLPALSIITDNANLFSADSGIYVNAFGHGPAWERECSVDLIDPDNEGFAVNAGLRIRGGWSRHGSFPKHSFRLFFRSQYGNSKLEYPLFGDEGVGHFDKIDLRTSQNYAWAQGDSRNTMLREVFSRDSQRDMGQPYTRSRFYHLYLNGMYWGLYQTQERSEARFASDYFGGSPDDYDVVKVNTEDWNYQIEATDGNLDIWREVYSLTQSGFTNMKNYYRLEGRDENGLPDKKSYKLVDIDNLIDYMLSIFYTGNFDAPTSSFGGNDGANNYYAINQRNNPTTGFIFFNHDAEHSLFAQAASPGIGLYEDRVNIGTRSDNLRMSVSWFGAFHPQWLHYKLSENAEYRCRFSDRVYKHFRSGGAFSVDSSIARYDKRRAEIDQAIIAESARWGDGGENVSKSYDRDRNWIYAANKTRNDFLPYRRNIVLNQLRAAKLYSELMPPILKVSGEQVITESIHFNDAFELEILNVNSQGEIYYTLDGNDPRLVGGNIHKNAFAVSGSLQLKISQSTIIKSRIFEGGEWSALNVTTCLNNSEDYSMLKITEIHYNPLDSIHGTDTISGNSFEFLEFKNTGDNSINLGGLKLDSAVNYVFPTDFALAPGSFFVIASDYIDFFERYGKYASGIFNKNLANNGEVITMYDRYNNEILRFSYDDESPWPLNADGFGYSLVARQGNPEGIPAMYDYWISSHDIGGSPFQNDPNTELLFQDEEFFYKLKIYPNPATEFIIVGGGSDQYDEIEMQIYSLSGVRLLSSKVYPGDRIELDKSVFKSGIYLVEMRHGQHISLSKLVIAR